MKRVVDYERLWGSRKLAALPSDLHRMAYAWFLGIAGPNGSFEWAERRIWADVSAPGCDMTQADVAGYLQSFLDAGLLLRWQQDGKTWGYFVGSEKPGLLPRDSWKKRFAKHRQLEPEPPKELLHADCTPIARQCRDDGVHNAARACGEIGVPESLSLCESLSLKEKENHPTPLTILPRNETSATPKATATPKSKPLFLEGRSKAKPKAESPDLSPRHTELRRQAEEIKKRLGMRQ